jgi:hypothetical protein
MATDVSNKLHNCATLIQVLLPKGYTVKKPSVYTIPAYMYEVHYEPVRENKVQRTTMAFRVTCEWSVLDDKMHFAGQLITATPEWHTYNTLEETVRTLCAMHRIGVM